MLFTVGLSHIITTHQQHVFKSAFRKFSLGYVQNVRL